MVEQKMDNYSSLTSSDRIRAMSDPEINARIDKDTDIHIEWYSNQSNEEIAKRISQLANEVTIELVLESRASLLALTGAMFGTQPTKQTIAKLRRLNVRTRSEIDRERSALQMFVNYGREE
jgi:hypothetical protein